MPLRTFCTTLFSLYTPFIHVMWKRVFAEFSRFCAAALHPVLGHKTPRGTHAAACCEIGSPIDMAKAHVCGLVPGLPARRKWARQPLVRLNGPCARERHPAARAATQKEADAIGTKSEGGGGPVGFFAHSKPRTHTAVSSERPMCPSSFSKRVKGKGAVARSAQFAQPMPAAATCASSHLSTPAPHLSLRHPPMGHRVRLAGQPKQARFVSIWDTIV